MLAFYNLCGTPLVPIVSVCALNQVEYIFRSGLSHNHLVHKFVKSKKSSSFKSWQFKKFSASCDRKFPRSRYNYSNLFILNFFNIVHCGPSSAVTIQFISRIPISKILKIEIFLWSNRFRFRFLGIRV